MSRRSCRVLEIGAPRLSPSFTLSPSFHDSSDTVFLSLDRRTPAWQGRRMMTASPSALFIGAAHVDRLGAMSSGRLHVSDPGRMREWAGGAALNSASHFAALGGRARLIAASGQDDAADRIARTAAARNIELEQIVSREHSTASYTALIGPDGNLVAALADMDVYDVLTPDVLVARDVGASEEEWLFLDANLPEATIRWLAGNESRPRIAAASVSVAKTVRLAGVLADLDVLFTNRREAIELTGESDEANSEMLATDLLKRGTGMVFITNGMEDMAVGNSFGIHSLPVEPVDDIADVTGAGDAFAGAAFFSLAAGRNAMEAAKDGIAAARMIVQMEGPFAENMLTQNMEDRP